MRGEDCVGVAVSISCVGVPVVVVTGLLVRCGVGEEVAEVVVMVGGCGRVCDGLGAAGTLSYPGLMGIKKKQVYVIHTRRRH